MQQTTRCTVSETGYANPKGGKKTVKNCHKLGEKHENCNPGRKLGVGNKKNRGVCWEGLAGMFSAKPEMITAC